MLRQLEGCYLIFNGRLSSVPKRSAITRLEVSVKPPARDKAVPQYIIFVMAPEEQRVYRFEGADERNGQLFRSYCRPATHELVSQCLPAAAGLHDRLVPR